MDTRKLVREDMDKDIEKAIQKHRDNGVSETDLKTMRVDLEKLRDACLGIQSLADEMDRTANLPGLELLAAVLSGSDNSNLPN